MPRLSRNKFSSGFFHVMIQGINKEYILENKINKEKYLSLIKKYCTDYKLKIVAYCIMDNHAHFIIYTKDIMQISKYMHKVNEIYAMEYNRQNNRVGHVFRDRYKSEYIFDREYLIKCIKYVHMNPVKSNIVEKDYEYLYSSCKKYKQNRIDKKIIELVFDSNKNYIKLYNELEDVEIEIMDIDNEESNFEIAVKRYLKENNIELNEIINIKNQLIDFSIYLINKRL